MTTRTVIRRKDTDHVDAAMRPTDQDYQRYIHLVDLYSDCGWQPAEQWKQAPFKIAEVQITALLAKATEDLLMLSERYGTSEDTAFLGELHESLVGGLNQQWRPHLNRFVSRDLISGQDIEKPTQAGFIPLPALDLSPQQVRQLKTELSLWLQDSKLALLPSVPASHLNLIQNATGAARFGESSTGFWSTDWIGIKRRMRPKPFDALFVIA